MSPTADQDNPPSKQQGGLLALLSFHTLLVGVQKHHKEIRESGCGTLPVAFATLKKTQLVLYLVLQCDTWRILVLFQVRAVQGTLSQKVTR